jgi:hypothetical protein
MRQRKTRRRYAIRLRNPLLVPGNVSTRRWPGVNLQSSVPVKQDLDRTSPLGSHLLQLPLQVLDLVPELRRVLELELLGGFEHLGL